MLTPEYLATFPDYIVQLFEQYDAFVVEDFARRVAKAAGVTDTAEWQAIRANEMGLSMDELTKRSSELLNITQDELKTMYQQAYDSYIESDEKRFSGSGLNYQRIANNPVLKEYMTAAQEQTQRALQNILGHTGAIKSMTGTTAVMLKYGNQYLPISKAYTMALDLAQMQVSTGVLDYNTAIRNAVKEISKQGVSTLIGDAVGYDSGYRISVSAAARMCVLTSVNQMAGNMNKLVCENLGLDLVETTAHMGARPSHQVWQGKIFSLSGRSKKYPSLAEGTGYGTVSGLMGANCRHNYYGYYEGSPRAYTDQQLYEMSDAGAPHIKYEGREYTYYEATQKQRQMERTIIATKRELIGYNAAGDEEAFTAASVKLQGQKSRYMEFSKKANLRSRTERIQQDGYDRVISGKSSYTSTNYHKTWLKSIGAETTSLNTLKKYNSAKENDTLEYRLLRRYADDVTTGWISPMVGFDNYIKTYNDIQSNIVGQTTSNGILISSQSRHFLQRVMGTRSDPNTGKSRSGVSIADIEDALFHTKRYGNIVTRSDGKNSLKFYGNSCIVSINPDTGELIQVNPWKED